LVYLLKYLKDWTLVFLKNTTFRHQIYPIANDTLHKKYIAKHLVSISSTFFARVFRTKVLFSSYVLATKSTFVQKMRAKNIDDIDTWCASQSPQHMVKICLKGFTKLQYNLHKKKKQFCCIQGTQNTNSVQIKLVLFYFFVFWNKNKKFEYLMAGLDIKQESNAYNIFFYFSNGLAYFFRAKQ